MIVCDDAASAETQRQVEELARRRRQQRQPPLFRYLPVAGTQGPAAARNAGWRAACGEIVAFTDDDCIPEADWLSSGLAMFDATFTRVDAVSGRVIVPLPPFPRDYELDAAGLNRAEFATANCFCRRDVLDSHRRV